MEAASITVTSAELRALGQGLNLTALRGRIGHLEALCNRKNETATEFKEAVQVAAIECGLIPGVLTQYIAARCSDTVRKKAQSAEQLSLLFGEEI